jgi:hypothetical protein
MTSLQEKMIKAIAMDEYTPVNGAVPECKEDASTWQEMIVNTPEDKGVFTSLLNAGLIWSDGRGKDAACGLTDKGFAEFIKLNK